MSSAFGKVRPYIRYFIALIMLVLLYRSGLIELEKIRESLHNPFVILSGFIIFLFHTLTFALRFKFVNTLSRKISFTLALKLHLIGQFFNTFIPGGVGGDVIKAVELSITTQQQKRSTLAITLIDRVFGLYGLICFSFLFLLFEYDKLSAAHRSYLTFSVILFAISTVCLVLRKQVAQLFEKLTQRLKAGFMGNVKESFLIFFEYLGNFLTFSQMSRFMLTSFIAQVLSVSFLYIVTTQLVDNPPMYAVFFPLACFGFVAMAIPVTPGGIGYGQAAFYFIFKSLGEPVAESAVIGISLMQLFILFYSLPGGYFFTRSSRRLDSTPVAPPADLS